MKLLVKDSLSLTVLTKSITVIFLPKKFNELFGFFSTKMAVILCIICLKIYVLLTFDVVSFEQPGPGCNPF